MKQIWFITVPLYKGSGLPLYRGCRLGLYKQSFTSFSNLKYSTSQIFKIFLYWVLIMDLYFKQILHHIAIHVVKANFLRCWKGVFFCFLGLLCFGWFWFSLNFFFFLILIELNFYRCLTFFFSLKCRKLINLDFMFNLLCPGF